MRHFLFVFIPGIVLLGSSMYVKRTDTVTVYATSLQDTTTHNQYPWLEQYDYQQTIINRIALPAGYKRTEVTKNSFSDWLRHLPLKKGNPAVQLYNGNLKGNQEAHCAIIQIDVGNEDLQQCADAVIRLRSEYLFSKNDIGNIHFNFTSGDNAEYSKWIEGYRPQIKGNKVSWIKSAAKDQSYKGFKSYLRQIFNYAGSSSLSKEMRLLNLSEMQPGDVFIKGGFPGHAVIVVDMAVHEKTGEKLFLLAQSYMPAQDIQLLKNPIQANSSPWYPLTFGELLETPEWTFQKNELKRFKNFQH